MKTTAATTTRNSVSLRSVLTALLGSVCSQGCSPAEAPAKLSADQSVCACARNGLRFDEEDDNIIVSMTRPALTALKKMVDLERLLARPDQKHKFQFNGEEHRVTIKKTDLCRMVEEIWKSRTGLSIKVDDVFVKKMVDAIDQAAAA